MRSRGSRLSHIRSLLLWLLGKLAQRQMIIRKDLHAPVLVDIRVELQLVRVYAAKHSHNRDAKHDLPGDFESNTKGIPHCVLRRLGQLRNNRDRLECYLDTLRELRQERMLGVIDNPQIAWMWKCIGVVLFQ